MSVVTVDQQSLETGICTEAAEISCVGRFTFATFGRNDRNYMHIYYPNLSFE
ncbi:hypothetical protein L580_4183 [Serratia fonticola AU-P3(3)]|nr:hypothetical protein L580_4183 [Serratia fonticola AU-P3(3)]